jgi:hypothetical protein
MRERFIDEVVGVDEAVVGQIEPDRSGHQTQTAPPSRPVVFVGKEIVTGVFQRLFERNVHRHPLLASREEALQELVTSAANDAAWVTGHVDNKYGALQRLQCRSRQCRRAVRNRAAPGKAACPNVMHRFNLCPVHQHGFVTKLNKLALSAEDRLNPSPGAGPLGRFSDRCKDAIFLCRISKPLPGLLPEFSFNVPLALPRRHSKEVTEVFVVNEIDAFF